MNSTAGKSVDLETEVVRGLSLRDPFMVASSHWTSEKNALGQLASVSPSAVTLKTTSEREGGAGDAITPKRQKFELVDVFGNAFATYTDGMKTFEMWDVAKTYEMTALAKELLPDTAIGLSVREGEHYEGIARRLELDAYAYVELNWKYTFRGREGLSDERFTSIADDLLLFCQVFDPLPILAKLPREAIQALHSEPFSRVLSILKDRGAGLLVANSRRIRVPPSRVTAQKPAREYADGVVVGEHLFLETYDALRTVRDLPETPSLAASGGINNIGATVDVVAAGANAVQLCTALDLWGVHVLPFLRDSLREICAPHGSFRALAESIQSSEREWYDAAESARRYEVNISEVARKVCSFEVALPVLAEALRLECTVPEGCAGSSSSEWESLKGARFVVALSSAASFLLAKRAVRALDFEGIMLRNAREFAHRLPDQSFEYDYAIMAESAYEHIRAQDERVLGGNGPVCIGRVGTCHVELVSDERQDLAEIQHVYHFGGNTARRAESDLLLKIRPTFREVQPIKLLPLLRGWQPGDGLLAKPPLSRLDGFLCPDGTREHWGPLWSHEESLVLVASKRSVADMEGQDRATVMLAFLHADRNKVLEDLDDGARQLMYEGFLDHCFGFLGVSALQSL